MPLSAASLAAMEAVMDANAEHVNEALLSYAYAWMRKAHDDKIPGAPHAQYLLLRRTSLTAGSKLSGHCYNASHKLSSQAVKIPADDCARQESSHFDSALHAICGGAL